jgi:glycerophosphoryl diester phosphodiesterase
LLKSLKWNKPIDVIRSRKPFVFVIILACIQCERVEYYPDKPITNVVTRVLAHKGGGGSFGDGNSFEACVYGLERLEGIEVDVQRGSDNVLWLSHSAEVPACGSFAGKCFPSLGEETIIEINSCLGKDLDFASLETLFDYVSKNYPASYLSLDVKAWSPCEVDGFNVSKEMNEMGGKIISLTKQYGLQNRVMVESESGDFLYYVKSNSDFIETYLVTLADFELGASRALEAGFSGISYQFDGREKIVKEQIDLLHRKGLKIQVWTIYDNVAFEEAKALGVDFIQTDDL